jgi:tetratricopeptide (TPR) repeat protein
MSCHPNRIERYALVALFLWSFALPTSGQEQAPQLPEADRLNEQVIQLYKADRYAEAVPLAQNELAIREKAQGSEHPDVAHSLNNLAELYRMLGDYGQAVPLYQHSLAIREKALGPEHPDVATALNNLALLYKDQGDYLLAPPLFQRSLAIGEKAAPTIVANPLFNMTRAAPVVCDAH